MSSAKKHIAYIVNSLNLGGTENLVVQMSQAFKPEFDISVICLDEAGLWAPKLVDAGIPVTCFHRKPGIDLTVARKIAAFCKKHRIDLIHAHQCTPWFYAALSRTLYPMPRLLFEEHGRFYPERYSWKKNFINKWFIQHLTHTIIAVSCDVRRRLARYEGISEKRIDVVYNGAHAPVALKPEERRARRRELGFAPDDFVIGTVGRLDPIKNLPLFINAFAGLQTQHRNLKGLLVGDGPDRESLKNLCDSSQATNNILMTGYRRDATELLQCMDLFVLCSFSEGTSMALLEAMASGIPAIVTDVGGNPELICRNTNGWLIPSDSIDDLVAAITQALRNPEMRMKFAEHAKKDFENRFSFAKMIDHYHRLYIALLQ